MKTMRDACKPRAEVLKGDLEDAIFAADFCHVVEGIVPDVYKNPIEFFRNTHPAERLKKIVRS
jgi:predicted AAA+ superfamily ATPase